MPAFPIVDTHLHLWDPTRLAYSWQRGGPLDRPYHVEDYQRDCRGVEIEAAVFLECYADSGQYVEEIEFAAEEAARDGRIRAIVPMLPLEQGFAVEAMLERMMERFPAIRGVRRIVQFDSDPRALMLSPKFLEAVGLLSKWNLHFEITAHYTQMDAVIEFTRRVPDHVTMVLDHCGKPGIRERQIDLFMKHSQELARRPNLMCKVSGLATEAGQPWTQNEIGPFLDVALTAFGVDRLMYGSDWPVCLEATTIPGWVGALDFAFSGLPEVDVRKIFRDNAYRFYRLIP
jgi:L-fuconolactonase